MSTSIDDVGDKMFAARGARDIAIARGRTDACGINIVSFDPPSIRLPERRRAILLTFVGNGTANPVEVEEL